MPYFLDVGLRNLVLGKFGQLENPLDLGLVFQNWVYQVLISAFGMPQVKHWRTLEQAKVDFVLEGTPHGDLLPIEVKYLALTKPNITRSLRSFIDKYQPKQAWVINLSLGTTQMLGQTQLRFVPLAALLAAGALGVG